MAATTGECSTQLVGRVGTGESGHSLEEEPRAARLEREDSRCIGMVEYVGGIVPLSIRTAQILREEWSVAENAAISVLKFFF